MLLLSIFRYNGVVGFQKIAFYDGMDTYLFRSASNSTFGSYFVTPANTKTECQVRLCVCVCVCLIV